MKTLAEIAGYRLYLDDRNYTIAKVVVVPEFNKNGGRNRQAGREKMVDPMFYGRLDHAVARLGGLIGDDLCTDLDSWLERFEQACVNVIEQLKGVK